MTDRCHVLLVSGSVRRGSTNSALLRTAQIVAPEGVTTNFYEDLDRLPHFNPDHDTTPLPSAVAELRSTIHAAGAVLFSTPEYAGALPGSFKNLLEWTVGDDQPRSIYEKPVAWVNASASPTGAVDAYESLGKVMSYVHASVVKDACMSIAVTRQMVSDDGLIVDPHTRARITRLLATLVTHACGG